MSDPSSEGVARLEVQVQCRLNGQVRDLRLLVRDDGLVLQGQAHTYYYAKQLAQQALREATRLPIRAHEIEVC